MSKLVCFYVDKSNLESLSRLKTTDFYAEIIQSSEFQVIEVYAGSQTTKFKNNKLYLDSPERYDSLSLKTYEMIKYCCNNFEFDILFKIDVTLTFDKKEERHWRNYFGVEDVRNFLNKDSYDDYDGIHYHNLTQKSFERWARKKNLKTNFNREFGFEFNIAGCFVGKCYCVSNKFAKHITSQSEFANSCVENLGGCEDIFISKCHVNYFYN